MLGYVVLLLVILLAGVIIGSFFYSKESSHASLFLVLCLKKALPCLNLQARSDLVVPKPDPYPIRHKIVCSPLVRDW